MEEGKQISEIDLFEKELCVGSEISTRRQVARESRKKPRVNLQGILIDLIIYRLNIDQANLVHK